MKGRLERLSGGHARCEEVEIDRPLRVDVNAQFLQTCEEAFVSVSVMLEGCCDVFRQ
jgi:hypothetical protein